MKTLYSPQARAERLIAAGRFVVASFSFFAIWLDPATPSRFQTTTYASMAAYGIYAAVVFVATWRAPHGASRWRLASHLFDLAIFSFFIYLTEGPVSPFFLYFVFSLFCATLRFRARGIILNALAVVAIYASIGLYVHLAVAGQADFEIYRFVIRTVYLVVLAALLVYLGAYQERLQGELASLANWPRAALAPKRQLVSDTLARVAELLRAPRVVLAEEDPEEPWVHLSQLSANGWEEVLLRPTTEHPLVAPQFEAVAFLCNDVAGEQRVISWIDAVHAVESSGNPIGSDLAAAIPMRSVLSVPLEGETVRGRLFIVDRQELTADDVVLAQVVGHLVVGTLEQEFFVRRERESATIEERLRLSRDLHDGILQSLTGVALHIRALQANAANGDFTIRERLEEIQKIIEDDQRELRSMVRDLRPTETSEETDFSLLSRLRSLRHRFSTEWNVSVGLDGDSAAAIPPELGQEVYRIVSEALSNAARHGNASEVDVRVGAAPDGIRIRVADNGRGFPFRGRLDLRALDAFNQGPRTMKERIVSLGGSLAIESSEAGAILEILLPMRQAESCHAG